MVVHMASHPPKTNFDNGKKKQPFEDDVYISFFLNMVSFSIVNVSFLEGRTRPCHQ